MIVVRDDPTDRQRTLRSLVCVARDAKRLLHLPPAACAFACLRRASNAPAAAEKSAERRTLHVARRGARGGMAEPIAHRSQLANGSIQLLRFRREDPAVDADAAVRCEHASHFIERKAGGASECDQGQPIEHAEIEETP